MQTLKDGIRTRILETAQKEFSKKGFLKTSVRRIAAGAGVGTGNLYNYFTNKDEIFRAVVNPVTVLFEKMLHKHHGRYGADIMQMTTEAYFREITEEYRTLTEQYSSLMHILFFRAQGSSLENFREQFTDMTTELVREWFADNKRKYPQMNIEVSDFFIHMHTVWMFSLFEEMIMHNIGSGEMEQIIDEYIRFEIHGWRQMMRI